MRPELHDLLDLASGEDPGALDVHRTWVNGRRRRRRQRVALASALAVFALVGGLGALLVRSTERASPPVATRPTPASQDQMAGWLLTDRDVAALDGDLVARQTSTGTDIGRLGDAEIGPVTGDPALRSALGGVVRQWLPRSGAQETSAGVRTVISSILEFPDASAAAAAARALDQELASRPPAHDPASPAVSRFGFTVHEFSGPLSGRTWVGAASYGPHLALFQLSVAAAWQGSSTDLVESAARRFTPPGTSASCPDRVAVFLSPAAPADSADALAARLSRVPGVAEATVFTQEDAYAEFRRVFATHRSLLASVTPSELPTSVRVIVRDPGQVSAVVDAAQGEPQGGQVQHVFRGDEALQSTSGAGPTEPMFICNMSMTR